MTRLPQEVFIVVRRGAEYLVVHRAPTGGAYWHGIAGGVEEGETYAEAAARELLEETGFAAEPVEISQPFVYVVGERSVTVTCYLVDVPSGWEPVLDAEHDDYRWCSRDDAVELLYWPEPKELLRTL
ncbi:MAG TPA: NUDIX domain-containing protein [Gaiellaceae bacterium]|nr:NUDIX domain-containing protein [Gaiellaceae bacterium]